MKSNLKVFIVKIPENQGVNVYGLIVEITPFTVLTPLLIRNIEVHFLLLFYLIFF